MVRFVFRPCCFSKRSGAFTKELYQLFRKDVAADVSTDRTVVNKHYVCDSRSHAESSGAMCLHKRRQRSNVVQKTYGRSDCVTCIWTKQNCSWPHVTFVSLTYRLDNRCVLAGTRAESPGNQDQTHHGDGQQIRRPL